MCHHLANLHLILIIIFNHLQDITVKQVLSGTPSQLASPRGALDARTATPLPMTAPLTLPDSSFDEINLKQVNTSSPTDSTTLLLSLAILILVFPFRHKNA